MYYRLLIVPPLLVALAACAAEAKAPPVSTNPMGSASQMPQPPGSVPPGAAVNAPLDPTQGNLTTTRTAPAR